MDIRKRYENDHQFRLLVDTMLAYMMSADFTPSEMRLAAILASIKHEELTVSPGFVVREWSRLSPRYRMRRSDHGLTESMLSRFDLAAHEDKRACSMVDRGFKNLGMALDGCRNAAVRAGCTNRMGAWQRKGVSK